MHRSALRTFRQMDVSTRERFNMGTFRHGEFSARGIFGTGTFRHGDISAHGHFGTVAQVPKCLCRNVYIALQGAKISMCRNVQVPKYPCAEMFLCQKFLVPKIPRAEKSPCRNVPVLKHPSAGTSAAPNGACAEMFPWWNIRAEMTLAKMFRAEMVYSRFWPLPPSFWSEANVFAYDPTPDSLKIKFYQWWGTNLWWWYLNIKLLSNIDKIQFQNWFDPIVQSEAHHQVMITQLHQFFHIQGISSQTVKSNLALLRI